MLLPSVLQVHSTLLPDLIGKITATHPCALMRSQRQTLRPSATIEFVRSGTAYRKGYRSRNSQGRSRSTVSQRCPIGRFALLQTRSEALSRRRGARCNAEEGLIVIYGAPRHRPPVGCKDLRALGNPAQACTPRSLARSQMQATCPTKIEPRAPHAMLFVREK